MTVTILLIAALLVSGAVNAVLIWAVFPMFRAQQRQLARCREALQRIGGDPHDLALLAAGASTDGALQWAGKIARASLEGEPPPPPLEGAGRLEVAPHCERAAGLLAELARTGAADHLAARDRLEVGLRVTAPVVVDANQAVNAIATAKSAEAEVRALIAAAAVDGSLSFGGKAVRDYAVTWVVGARPRVVVALSFEEPTIHRGDRAAVEGAVKAALAQTPQLTLAGFSITSSSARWAQDEAAADVPRQLRAIARQLLEISVQALQERGRWESIRQRRPALEVERAEQLLIEKIAALSARAVELDD